MTTFVTAIRMRDGTRLATEVRLPDGEGPWPATLYRTPYRRTNEMLALPAGAPVALVLQDVRGRFDSEGGFDFGAHDIADGEDTVGWIAAQPWCTGSVAMHGISYAGYTQLQAARSGAPALRSIGPARCPAWWRPLTMHEGGAVCLSLAAHWIPLQAGESPEAGDTQRAAMWASALTFDQIVDYPPGPPTAQGRLRMDAALAHPMLSRRPLRERPELAGSPVFAQAWRDLWDRPFTQSWLDDTGPARDGPRCPTLLLSGWYDLWAQDTVAMWSALSRLDGHASPHRLVMTPYSHAPEPAGEIDHGADANRFTDAMLMGWNLEWLLDHERRWRDLAPVTYFLVGASTWCEAGEWPPAGTDVMELHCAAGRTPADGRLIAAPPSAASSVQVVHDPREPAPTMGGPSLGLPMGPVEQSGVSAGARPDVVSFTGDSLVDDLDILGEVIAWVTVSAGVPDFDVVVKLIDVWPDGRSYNIADGIRRVRHRAAGREALLRPGVPATVGVHCWNIAYRVGAGHRLRVDVQWSSFPRYDVNAQTGAASGSDRTEDLRIGRMTVHTGALAGTTVRIRVFGATRQGLTRSLSTIARAR